MAYPSTCPDCRQVYGPDAHVCAVSGGTRCPVCNDLCPDNEVEDNMCIDCYEGLLLLGTTQDPT
jgi:hypothetical protein